MAVIHVGIYDGIDDNGEPVLTPYHPQMDSEERDRVVSYLKSGFAFASSPGLLKDLISNVENIVPSGYRTDGQYVWGDEISYYAETYGLAPSEDFLEYLRSVDYQFPELSSESISEVVREMFGE